MSSSPDYGRLDRAQELFDAAMAEHENDVRAALASFVGSDIGAVEYADRFDANYTEALHHVCWDKAREDA